MREINFTKRLILEFKFESKIVSPNQKDASGETILNLAVADADKYAVEMLLNKGLTALSTYIPKNFKASA